MREPKGMGGGKLNKTFSLLIYCFHHTCSARWDRNRRHVVRHGRPGYIHFTWFSTKAPATRLRGPFAVFLSFFLYLSFFLSVVLELSCNLQNNFLTPKRHFHVPKFCCLPHRLGWELFVYLSLNIGIAFRESDGEGTNVAGYDEAPVGLAIFHRGRVSGLLSLSNAGLLVIERLAHIR
jgi:hypothetical protein